MELFLYIAKFILWITTASTIKRIPGRAQRHPRKHTSRPSIGIHHRLFDQSIPTQLGEDYCPDSIVDGSCSEYTQRHDAVQVVWQFLVYVLAITGRDVRSNHQIHIRQEEENGDWKSCADSRIPVGKLGLVEVDVDEPGRNKGIDDGKRV